MAEPSVKVIHALRQALVDGAREVHATSAPEHHAARIQAERDHLDRLEVELEPLVSSIRDQLVGNANLPPVFRNMLDAATEHEHAAIFTLISNLILAYVFQVMGSLVPPSLQDAVNDEWQRFQANPLSAAESALAYVRGTWSLDQAAAEAELTGFNAERLDVITKNTGGPPGLQELLYLRRRGLLTDDDLERGIRQSNYRNEWIDSIKDLIHVPPGAAEVMAGYTANQITEARARQLWDQNGMTPEDFDWVYQTTGPPPPTQEMITLWRRGDVTEAEVREALLEGPTKNKWIPTVMKFKRRTPPMEQVIALTRRGVFTAAEATEHLSNLGFDEDVVAGLVKYATAARTEAAHDLTVANYLTAYKDGLAGEAETTGAIQGLGYSGPDAAFLVRTATFQRDHAESSAIVTAVRSRYVAHHIDRADASGDLDALGVDPGQRDRLLRLWDIARNNVTQDLTVAQLTAMVKKGLIDGGTYAARLARHGYAPGDVDLLLQLNLPAVAPVA